MTESYFISKRRWFKGNTVNPLKITTTLDSPTTSTLIGSPSPVKALFPSLSMFNLPTSNTPTYTKPPPQFAVDMFKRDKLVRKLKPRRKIEKGYPSALDTYLFDDIVPGTLSTQGIRPVRLLIERLEAWHHLSKRLLYHFELLASIESHVSKTYRQLDTATIFPSPHHTTSNYHHHRHRALKKIRHKYKGERLLQIHFNFNTGIKSMCDALQKYHVDTTQDHASCATFLRNEAIPILRNIKHELKWMIKSIQQDDRLSLTTLTRLKRKAAKRLKKLDRQLIFFDEHPYLSHSKKDPWLMNAAVVKQMVKVYRQENKIHETVLRLQREILVSEDQIVLELKQLCQQLYTLSESSNLGLDKGIQHIMATMNDIQSDWTKFHSDHADHLVSEHAAFRHPDHLQYPNHTHPLLQPIFAARMERRSKFRKWKESIHVLTEAGFLHEYAHPNSYPAHPSATIYVPHYKVSLVSTHLHSNLVFELQPHKAARRQQKSEKTKQWYHTTPRWGCKDRWTWTLRAKSAEDMDVWIKCLTRCSERYRCAQFTPEIIVSPAKEVEKEEAATEETQTEDKPAEEEKPTEDGKPSEDKPAEEPVPEEKAAEEEKPAEEDKPAEDTPAEDKPAEEKPTEEPAAEDKSTDDKPVEAEATPEPTTEKEEKVENAVFE